MYGDQFWEFVFGYWGFKGQTSICPCTCMKSIVSHGFQSVQVGNFSFLKDSTKACEIGLCFLGNYEGY